MKSDGCLLNISTIQCPHDFIMKRQTASKAVPMWARLRARVPHPQHSAAHRHTRRKHPDVATPTSHLHCHTRTHLGVHRLRTSHQRLFYFKGSNQTTQQDLSESHLLLPELPSQKPWSSGLWGTPGGECCLPPPNPAPQRSPRQTQRSQASRITMTGLCTPTRAKDDQLGAGSVPSPCLRSSLTVQHGPGVHP